MALKKIDQFDVVEKDSITSLIYGFPGLGKTSVVQTAQDTVLLDFDKRIHAACRRQTAYQMDSWADVQEFQKDAKNLMVGKKTLVMDTVGIALDDYLASHVMKIDPKNRKYGGGISLQGYGAMKDVFKEFYNSIKELGVDIIFVCHLTEKQEGDDTLFRPKITGGSYDILVSTVDQMGYMYMDQGKRMLAFRPTFKAVSKDSAGVGNLVIPSETKPEYDMFFHTEVIQKSKDSIKERNQKSVEYAKILDAHKEKIEGFSEAEQINESIDEVNAMEGVPTGIKTQIKYMIAGKAKSLGLKFNSDDKKYENPED